MYLCPILNGPAKQYVRQELVTNPEKMSKMFEFLKPADSAPMSTSIMVTESKLDT